MRWVAIIIVLAAIIATGWFILRLGPAQPFLKVPVPSSEQDNPTTDPTVADVLDPGESEPETELDDLPETDPPEPESSEPDLPTATDPAPDPDPDPEPTNHVLEGEAALAQYRTWISEARVAHPYSDSEQRMYEVMMCESGGQADIINPAGPYTGLFQYADGTWNGEWNTYRDSEATDARAQIFATALAWSLDMQSQWGCYSRAH